MGEGLFENVWHSYVWIVENMLSTWYPERMLRVTNSVPVIVYIHRIFHWLRQRSAWCEKVVCVLERKAYLKGKTV